MSVYRRMYRVHRWLDDHPGVKCAVALAAVPLLTAAAALGEGPAAVAAALALIGYGGSRIWCVTIAGPAPG